MDPDPAVSAQHRSPAADPISTLDRWLDEPRVRTFIEVLLVALAVGLGA
jgi:hypothetical protein